MSDSYCISWLPSWVDARTLHRANVDSGDDAPLRYYGLRPAAQDWPELREGLSKAHEALRQLTVAQIVEALDKTCLRWANRDFVHRVKARQDVVAATGFSPEAVDRSFDVELGNYRAETLNKVLRRELGDPEVLDRFKDDSELSGHTLAVGPRLTTVVCSGNVPGLPALSLVRAMLVKSAVIVKVASGEPTFAAHFVRSLAEVNPILADAVIVTYWRSDDVAALHGAVEQSDAVIAYGGSEACSAIRAHLGPHQRYVEHGHKVSAGAVTQNYLASVGLQEVARRAAEDISTFNQHACIAPQVFLVEQGRSSARDFAEALAQAMAEHAADIPLGTVPAADAAALQIRRASMAWTAATDVESGFWRAPGLDWTVTLAPELVAVHGTGNRMVSVIPVATASDIPHALRPLASQLQNVGLGAVGEEFWTVAAELGQLGACRISEPGRMATPSVVWRHDGMPCVSRLVQWCDIEMHSETATHTGNR
ncbi:acyl-CoA reductase [Streptomyces sp. NBC_00233]|uniref:acyl-CoA reductase n=1 Tax=Streptomyces sp. NBC_00233 TaxID=2975686 RepID=UPI00225882FF|nr:acyl-CoA reductase [Streptomyces sp. NBC_00233]MCX5233513.1 hypothetical protein [Streptomyces sp. NBC_00233]